MAQYSRLIDVSFVYMYRNLNFSNFGLMHMCITQATVSETQLDMVFYFVLPVPCHANFVFARKHCDTLFCHHHIKLSPQRGSWLIIPVFSHLCHPLQCMFKIKKSLS